MKLDIQELETFIAVIEAGGVSRAAEAMSVSKSVVSKRLSDLEHRLNAKLLHRSTRRILPTDNGTTFYAHAKEALARLVEAAENAAFTDSGLHGRLNVLAPMSFGTTWLAPLVAQFMHINPHLEVNLHLDDRLLDFEPSGFDVCVRVTQLTDSTLIARRLADCERTLCASPSYLEQHGTPQTLDELAEHECILYSNISARQFWAFESAPSNKALPALPAGRLSSNNGEVMREMTLAGLGLALLPNFLIHQHLLRGELVPVLEQYRAQRYSIYAMYPRSSRASPKITALCDFLQQQLAEPPWEAWRTSAKA